MPATRENFPLLDELLAEQQRLATPVAGFSASHEPGSSIAGGQHRSLIPLTAPGPGEQYAFEVDLDACTGCKSCVAACHSLNGLDENETWRDVGVLISPSRARPFTQTVTSACHHCADPACLNGCPVLAYEKDPVTGIVRHLDDQCIGCSYCILKCPYDVPKYSARLGIVRKCDLCHTRLAADEAPACAQACPTHAIRITTVAVGDSSRFLAAAPEPTYTKPATRYVSRRVLPEDLVAGDAADLRPQPAHWPLVIMLTAVPVAIGCELAAVIASVGDRNVAAPFTSRQLLATGWLLAAAGLAASVFHLGQPRRAWRIFLGWRTSWLSREAVVLGGWFAVATATLRFPQLAAAATGVGLAGLTCSALIYIDTRRHFWRASQTVPRLFGTAAVTAIAWLAPAAGFGVLLAKLAIESRTYFDGSASARLQRGPLARIVAWRDTAAVAGLVLLLVAPPWGALPVVLAGECAERLLFFRAVDAPKMPGLPT